MHPSVTCVCVCAAVCVCVHFNSKNNLSTKLNLKLTHTNFVVYENSSEKFDIGHCPIKVKVMAEIFLHLTQYKLLGPISQLWHMLRVDCDQVCLLIR